MIDFNLITNSMTSQQDQDHLNWIGEAIKFGLFPWDPGKITFYVSYEHGGMLEPCLIAETERLPKLPFAEKLDLLSKDDHQALAEYADKAFEWFRYRYRIEPEDHIILGED